MKTIKDDKDQKSISEICGGCMICGKESHEPRFYHVWEESTIETVLRFYIPNLNGFELCLWYGHADEKNRVIVRGNRKE